MSGTGVADVGFDSGLSAALLGLVQDRARVAHLYGLLGEYCHLLRNRLNCLKMSLYLARRQPGLAAGNEPAWDDVDEAYAALEAFIDRFQAICRPMRLTPIRAALGLLLAEHEPRWARRLAERGIGLELNPPRSAAIGQFDPSWLGKGLDALVAWRAERAEPGTMVRLSWHARDGQFGLDWHEPDGHGPLDDEFAGEAPRLALPLLARVIAEHGGKCTVAAHEGFQVSLRWPLDVTHP